MSDARRRPAHGLQQRVPDGGALRSFGGKGTDGRGAESPAPGAAESTGRSHA